MARLDYFAPGVYVEEVDRGSRPIAGVPTAIAGFLGFTEDVRGGAEMFKPMLTPLGANTSSILPAPIPTASPTSTPTCPFQCTAGF